MSPKQPLDIHQSLQLALRHHQSGELQQAEYAYNKILATDPNNADANHLLGVIAHQCGKDDKAIRLIRKAIRANPRIEAFHNNLGEALRSLDNLDKAVACYKKAISIKPNYAEAHNNLGNALIGLCQLNKAVACFNRAITIQPNYAEAYCSLGDALSDLGRLEKAITCYNRAIAIKPGYSEAYNNLGNARKDLVQLDEAIEAYKKALAIQPGCAEIHNNLGSTLDDAGYADDAVACYQSAISFDPDYAEAFCNLGVALRGLGQVDQAIASHKKAISISPDYADAYSNLGVALQDKGQLAEAVACFRKAISINPDYADAYSNLGVALQELMQMDEAVASFRKALSINPDYPPAHSNLLFTFNYQPDLSAEDIFAEYKCWNKYHAKPLLPIALTYVNNRDGERKLKIGYISPDFRRHSVAYFFEPLLKQHDRTRVEIYCYSNVKNPDAVTQRLKENSDHWCSIFGMSDQSAAARVRRDEIDILVDLAGHTENNRLLVLARKPAPIQVTWLGYPNTTGLTSIDYRFTDEIADPVGLSDMLHSEELIRLESGFLSYQGIESASARSTPPCLERGHITFGSFNNLTKVVPQVVSLWSEILRAVPDAHLLLKSRQLSDGEVRQRYLAMFKAGQIDKDRIELHSKMPSIQDHLQLYSKVDIGLDPFPYNGTTTTCEALWMGVPVITMLGDRHAGRVGASLLTRVGLDELIAVDPKSYIDVAIGLAEDPDKLARLRRCLRKTMDQSELCNAANLARKIEDAYAVMWKKYLSKSQS